MTMKRIISLILLTVATVCLQAQGFELYMANNLSDAPKQLALPSTI